ncbi:adenine phosphoribosyltransferase [Isoptericola sp. NEAU-Y5]|uniref:Adenine phosphoribosyltransferase n=1 Tax=Isoptericola luteus TaxID=2879484 RepID=A0ABS7ZG90_9MICO|nr:adenine phosphoribosyltransferase [Isoptericola sp. NEAU-Y5]MCA5894040.1 adenine phosphoribosyltransferase [Isoptericola sp. NEAU-Y5]
MAAAQDPPEPGEGVDDIVVDALAGLGPRRAAEIRALIRDVPDYPHPPVVFRDITPLLADGPALADVVEAFARLHLPDAAGRVLDGEIDVVAGMEARGFLLGAPLATRLGVGFLPLRKAGKLPPPVERVDYDLEYGSAAIELRTGTLRPGARVLLIDDVLATGGTARAAADLVERSGGHVMALAFLMELSGLGGRDRLAGRTVESLLRVGS